MPSLHRPPLKARNGGLGEYLRFAHLHQPSLLAKVAKGFGHGDPRHTGHFRQLAVGEIHSLQGNAAPLLCDGPESLTEPEQQIEQPCFSRPYAGDLQQHAHLLDVGR